MSAMKVTERNMQGARNSGESHGHCYHSNVLTRSRKRSSVSQDVDGLGKRSTSITDILDSFEEHDRNFERSERSMEIRQLISNIIITPENNDASSDSSRSSGVSFCSSFVDEEIVEAVTVCTEDASPILQGKVTSVGDSGKVWNVNKIQNGENVEVDSSNINNQVEIWKKNSNQFVFAFGGTATPYYVSLPSGGSGKLILTTQGINPPDVTNPASDPRVLSLVYDSATGKRHLIPTSNTNLRIVVENGYAVAKVASNSQATGWVIE